MSISARERQDNAIAEGRIPNIEAEYDEGVFINKVGLCGEVVVMIWVAGLYAGMAWIWHRFKTGDIWQLADIECGRWRHTLIEVKANEEAHPTNYLIVKVRHLPDNRSCDDRIFVHTYVENYAWRNGWAFSCAMMVITGWCFGWELRLAADRKFPVPGAYNLAEDHTIMKPMHELERLIKLRERYGAADGEVRWERGDRI